MNKVSALSVLSNAVLVWNTVLDTTSGAPADPRAAPLRPRATPRDGDGVAAMPAIASIWR